jgi:hypothetical protein
MKSSLSLRPIIYSHLLLRTQDVTCQGNLPIRPRSVFCTCVRAQNSHSGRGGLCRSGIPPSSGGGYGQHRGMPFTLVNSCGNLLYDPAGLLTTVFWLVEGQGDEQIDWVGKEGHCGMQYIRRCAMGLQNTEMLWKC